MHEQGKAHQWTQEEARIAGSKGGKAPRRKPVDGIKGPLVVIEEVK